MFRAVLCALAIAIGVGVVVTHPTSAEIIAIDAPAVAAAG
jgi:hypothetical protein